MRKPIVALAIAIATAIPALPAAAEETPATIVAAYEALADTVLSVRATEQNFVLAMLDGHRHAAMQLTRNGDWDGAAAHMALFATEGDNAIAGVRKRLLEGGHHFNAAGEEAGLFEEGYVVVSRAAKAELLQAVTNLRQAGDDGARQAAWEAFDGVAKQLLGMD